MMNLEQLHDFYITNLGEPSFIQLVKLMQLHENDHSISAEDLVKQWEIEVQEHIKEIEA